MHKDTATLWPTYIFTYEYKDFQSDLKDELVAEIYKQAEKQRKDINSGVAESLKSNLKESHFSFFNSHKEPIVKLKQFFIDSLNNMISVELPKVDAWKPTRELEPKIFDSWYHIANNGGFHDVHLHSRTSWAGIFYVQSDECTFEGLNGINNFFNFDTNKNILDAGAEWTERLGHFRAEPKEGNLILFPGWVPHNATPYKGNQDRIVVSVNTQILYK
tara:strand:- start:398 stop:1048 length:651 start_codon:yes stop_codon:yes gene_type:complete